MRQYLTKNNIKRPIIYITGADTATFGGIQPPAPVYHGDTATFYFRWGDKEPLTRIMNELGNDYKFNVVAHSAGGGAALSAIRDAKVKPGGEVKLLDPVDFNPANNIKRWVGIDPYNGVGARVTTQLPTNVDGRNRSIPGVGSSDFYVTRNPMALGHSIQGDTEVIHPQDTNHSMHGSRMRADIVEPAEFVDAVLTKPGVGTK